MSRPSSPQGECRSCGAKIWWADYVKKAGGIGKTPVDFDPVPHGTIQLFRRPDGSIRAAMLTKKQAQDLREQAKALGTEVALRASHFASCAQAEGWRDAP